MDLAKQFAQLKEQPPEQWIRAANRYLPPGFTAILVLAIAYELSTLTWALMPGAAPVSVAPAPSRTGKAATPSSASFAGLLDSHLFGEAAKVPVQVVETVVDAPDTTLSLSLKGILSRDGDGKGWVIISSGRDDKTYQVGQAIENASGTTLHSVYADRVLLDRGDRLETLRLPKEQLTGAPAPAARVASPARAPAAAAPAANPSMRSVISANATKLTEIVKLQPQIQEGQVIGFRVNPGRDRTAFESLGLLPGDVVTDINGVVLNDASRGLQAFEALGEATMANVTVLRDGVPQVLVIDTSQLQNIGENRE